MSKYMLKVVLLGGDSVGKTCFIRRYADKTFPSGVHATIGCDFTAHTEITTAGDIKLQVWDTTGHDRSDDIVKRVIDGVNVYVLMYSVVDRRSFDRLVHWRDVVKTKIQKAKVYIVGTKLDIVEEDPDKRVVTMEMVDPIAHEFGCEVVETSARSGTNIDAVFQKIAEDFLTAKKDEPTNKTRVGAVFPKIAEDFLTAKKDEPTNKTCAIM